MPTGVPPLDSVCLLARDTQQGGAETSGRGKGWESGAGWRRGWSDLLHLTSLVTRLSPVSQGCRSELARGDCVHPEAPRPSRKKGTGRQERCRELVLSRGCDRQSPALAHMVPTHPVVTLVWGTSMLHKLWTEKTPVAPDRKL